MERVKKQAYSLDAIQNLMAYFGNVQDQLNVIHIAGTNGKGSVGAYISAILSAQGYRTGTYASPAVFDSRETIKINGEQIPKEDFDNIMSDVHKACEKMQQEGFPYPSAFEAETALAFCYFKQQKCDFAVIEAGLGGRDDATNLVKHPVCSVFTSISMDHMNFLGDTLEEIAAAKAGIIKSGCPCVSAEQKPSVLAVLKNAAIQAKSTFYVGDQACIRNYRYDADGSSFFAEWDLEDGRELLQIQSVMTGAFQQENFACALEVIRLLRKQGTEISRDAVETGLCSAYLPGRFEKILDEPAFYIDGGHNEGAAQSLAKTLQHCFPKKKMVYIIGVLADKEYQKVLRDTLPYASQVFTVTPDNPRALDGRVLAEEAARIYKDLKSGSELDRKLDFDPGSDFILDFDSGAAVSYVADMHQAVARAINAAGSQGVVLAFGSFSFLKQLRETAVDNIYCL